MGLNLIERTEIKSSILIFLHSRSNQAFTAEIKPKIFSRCCVSRLRNGMSFENVLCSLIDWPNAPRVPVTRFALHIFKTSEN